MAEIDTPKTKTDQWTFKGKPVTPDCELTFTGIRGRFRFLHHVTLGSEEWLEVVGGPRSMFRAFPCDRVSKVYPIKAKHPKAP